VAEPQQEIKYDCPLLRAVHPSPEEPADDGRAVDGPLELSVHYAVRQAADQLYELRAVPTAAASKVLNDWRQRVRIPSQKGQHCSVLAVTILFSVRLPPC